MLRRRLSSVCMRRWLPISSANSQSRLFRSKMPAKRESHARNVRIRLLLFVAQRDHGIHLHGAARWNVARQQGCPNEEQRDPGESEWVGGGHAEEQRLDGARQGQRADNPNYDPNEDRAQSLA